MLVAQLCRTLCDPMECSPPVSSVHGILQARILEWVAMPSSRGFFQPRDGTMSHVSCVSFSLPLVPPGKPSSQITSQIFQHEFVFCRSPRKYDQNIPSQVLFSCCPSTLPFAGRRLKSSSIQGNIYPFSTLEKPPFI